MSVTSEQGTGHSPRITTPEMNYTDCVSSLKTVQSSTSAGDTKSLQQPVPSTSKDTYPSTSRSEESKCSSTNSDTSKLQRDHQLKTRRTAAKRKRRIPTSPSSSRSSETSHEDKEPDQTLKAWWRWYEVASAFGILPNQQDQYTLSTTEALNVLSTYKQTQIESNQTLSTFGESPDPENQCTLRSRLQRSLNNTISISSRLASGGPCTTKRNALSSTISRARTCHYENGVECSTMCPTTLKSKEVTCRSPSPKPSSQVTSHRYSCGQESPKADGWQHYEGSMYASSSGKTSEIRTVQPTPSYMTRSRSRQKHMIG